MTVQQLKQMQDAGEPLQLVDVRERWELDICALNDAVHIPMGEVIDRKDELRKDVPLIISCRSGKRSCNVVHALKLQLGLTNLYNLKGGILAWADEIDTTLEKY